MDFYRIRNIILRFINNFYLSIFGGILFISNVVSLLTWEVKNDIFLISHEDRKKKELGPPLEGGPSNLHRNQ